MMSEGSFFDNLLPLIAGSAAQLTGGSPLADDPILGQLFSDPEIQAQMAALAPGGDQSPAGLLASVAAEQAEEIPPLPKWAKNIGLPNPLEKPRKSGDDPFMGAWVYFGEKKGGPVEFEPGASDATPRGFGSETPSVTVDTPDTDRVRSLSQAMTLPYTWDDDEITAAIKRMQKSGLEVTGFEDMLGVWEGLVQRAAITYSRTKGEKKLTPWDVLDLTANERATALGDAASDRGFTGSRTTRQRSVSDISEGQAWSVLQSNLSQMLGRDPSDQEVRDFTYRMNQLAARNPSISKTITKYKNGEAVSSSTETETGLTADDVLQKAYESAQNDPGYAEFQAASTYFNAAQAALGAIGDA